MASCIARLLKTVICCWPQIPATIESLKVRTYARTVPFLVVVVAPIFICSCAAPFGPGYTIEKQDIDVHFEPGPPPHISIKSNYQLKNTGTRAFSDLELRLPGRRRFNSQNVSLSWDGQALAAEESAANARNTLIHLPREWAVSDRHTLDISMDFLTPSQDELFLGFAPDAFFLPAQGWAPELMPARGAFATGGAPPTKWNLTVHVPKGFIVHASGSKIKTSKHGEELEIRATQQVADIYPYVIAGRYVTKQIGSGREKIYLWTRKEQATGELKAVSDSLVKASERYNAVFGGRSVATAPRGFFGRHHAVNRNEDPPLWLVECPVIPGCFSGRTRASGGISGNDGEAKPGEMVSLDTAMIDPSPGAKNMVSVTAPALAATWLGYGQSPGFYEQDPPLSAFPAFAAAVGNEALNGTSARTEAIRRGLAAVPQSPASNQQGERADERALRAKSLLFFYGLQDRYGDEVFRKAIRHMLYARRSGGFDLDDLIAAFDQEAHGNTAEFVRLWMKHPGVPADFRARYENTSAEQKTAAKETTP
jgi:hypothetical protein